MSIILRSEYSYERQNKMTHHSVPEPQEARSATRYEFKTREIIHRTSLQESLSRHFLKEDDFKTGLSCAFEMLCRHFNWKLGVYWKLLPQIGSLRFEASWIMPFTPDLTSAASFLDRLRNREVHWDHGLAGKAWTHGLPSLYDPLISDQTLFEGYRPTFAVPIQDSLDFFGIAEFCTSLEEFEFDPGFESLCTMIEHEFSLFVRRIKRQDATRNSQARKTAVFETAVDAIISLDHENRILDFNPAAEKLFRCDRTGALGEHLNELIIPARLRTRHDRDFFQFRFNDPAQMTHLRTETLLKKTDGGEFKAEMTLTRTPGPNLSSARFTCYIRELPLKTPAIALAKPNEMPPQTVSASDQDVLLSDDAKIRISPTSFTVRYQGRVSSPLTSKEFQIMVLLQKSRDLTVSRSELLNQIWGNTQVSTNSLDVHLYNLRRKLAEIKVTIAFRRPDLYQLLS